jgi:hypothetical protein
MLDALPKSRFSVSLHPTVSNGSPHGTGCANRQLRARFIASETVGEAIEPRVRSNARATAVTLDLGERRVHRRKRRRRRAATEIIADIERAGVGRNISIKLTRWG